MRSLTALSLLLATSVALADGDTLSVPDNAKWQEECGSCHIAYPPQLLTADNWQRMMSHLDRHFGANAELDAADNRYISAFLKRYAARSPQHRANSLRISDTAWFKREHDEVARNAWTDPAVRSPANCSACHIGAEDGDWSEDGIEMPEGLSTEDDDDEDDDD